MVKKYFDLKLEENTYNRFKHIKKGIEFQNHCDYSISQFVEFLLDGITKNIGYELKRIEKCSTK